MPELTKTMGRCGAVALSLTLVAGPGATAWADSSRDDRPRTHAAKAAHKKAASKAAAHKAAAHKKAKAAKAKAGKPKAGKKRTQLAEVSQPSRLLARQRVDLEDGADLEAKDDAKSSRLLLRLGDQLAEDRADLPVVVTGKKPKQAASPLALLDIGPSAVAPAITAQSTGSAVVSLSPVRAQQVSLSRQVTRPVAARALAATAAQPVTRVPLPDEDNRVLAIPAASEADVPLYVALVGILLVMVGMRRVGSFRRAGDPDLTWD